MAKSMDIAEHGKPTRRPVESETEDVVIESNIHPPMPASISSALTALNEDYHSLNPRQPPLLPYPTSLQFCKQVSKGLPCVYSLPPGRQYCPAQSWTRFYLAETIIDPVEVAVTPDGRADALHHLDSATEPVFLQPANIHMSMSSLLSKLDRVPQQPVYYLQSQNGNLNTTNTPLMPLLKDLPANLPFAQPVLGTPEAINIWIGTSASVTSTHRDPYENLYFVLKGTKTFTLFAPVDEFALCAQHVRTGRFVYNADADSNCFTTKMDDPTIRIPWIPIDPRLPRAELLAKFPLYAHAQPQRITVREGQLLYLPAGWFHFVEQECGTWPDDGSVAPCVAVNYWFDQDYEGEKYVMREHVGRLAQQARDEMASKPDKL